MAQQNAPPSRRGVFLEFPRQLPSGRLRFADVHLAALELDGAFDQAENRVILAQAGVEPGAEPRAALADDDAAGGDALAPVALDAQVLRIGVAAVFAAALALFVCHLINPPAEKLRGRDRRRQTARGKRLPHDPGVEQGHEIIDLRADVVASDLVAELPGLADADGVAVRILQRLPLGVGEHDDFAAEAAEKDVEGAHLGRCSSQMATLLRAWSSPTRSLALM